MRGDAGSTLDAPNEGSAAIRGGRDRRSAVPWAAALTAVVIAGGLSTAAPLRDGATLAAATGVRLVHEPAYLLLAPLLALLDSLSLLTMREHYALVGTVLVVFAAWRLTRSRLPCPRIRRSVIELRAATIALLAIVALYAVGLLVERPMVKLVADHPDDVIIDFHSHTNASWDTRGSFDVERNRRWHRDAGFHIAYITDHRTFAAVQEAAYTNPARAGDGVSLLSAVEVGFGGRHVSALGRGRRYEHLITQGVIQAEIADAAIRRGEPDPMLVLALPASLEDLRAAERGVLAGLSALEIVDGAPRGLEQGRRDRALLLRIADSLDLAIVAGSNNHGWGRTAAGWNVMRIPGWRDLHPDSVGALIEHRILTERRSAVRVVERAPVPPSSTRSALAFTGPAIAWRTLSTLSAAERAAWIAWIWTLALIVPAVRAAFVRRPRIRFN